MRILNNTVMKIDGPLYESLHEEYGRKMIKTSQGHVKDFIQYRNGLEFFSLLHLTRER